MFGVASDGFQGKENGPGQRDDEREHPYDHDDQPAHARRDLAPHGVADGERPVHRDGDQRVDGRRHRHALQVRHRLAHEQPEHQA